MFVATAIVACTGDAADIGHQITIAIVSAGGRQVVAGAGDQQCHQRIDQRGLAAAGRADDCGAGQIDLCTVPATEGAPVVEIEMGEDVTS